ncbi:hypothetical protein AB0B88_16045 [Micromonospora haikouensis]|uniref:hypothetical protein n=1 Tax=Micromonospora haikouensis TaxID=686309 RepID=UPI0033E2BAF1
MSREQTEQVVVDDLYRITLDRGDLTVTVEVAAQDTPTGLTPVGYDHQIGWAERHGKEYAAKRGYSLSGEWTQKGRQVQAPIELDPLAVPGMKIRLTPDEDAPEEYYASLYWASGQVWDLGTIRHKVANYGDLRDGWKWLRGSDETYYDSPSEAVSARIGAMYAGLDLSTARVVEW